MVDRFCELCARLETEKGLEEGINPYRRNAEQVIHEGFRLNAFCCSTTTSPRSVLMWMVISNSGRITQPPSIRLASSRWGRSCSDPAQLYADITYYDTEYRDFPLPRLVFGFQYMPQEGKVAGCRVCVASGTAFSPSSALRGRGTRHGAGCCPWNRGRCCWADAGDSPSACAAGRRPEFDMTIHISTERGEVVVEQQKAGGVTTHKNITPQALCDCLVPVDGQGVVPSADAVVPMHVGKWVTVSGPIKTSRPRPCATASSPAVMMMNAALPGCCPRAASRW